MKIHCHKAVLSAFVSEGAVYFSALVMLYGRFEMIKILLLGLCFQHSVNKSVRGDVHPAGKMLQKELLLRLPEGWQIQLPLLF